MDMNALCGCVDQWSAELRNLTRSERTQVGMLLKGPAIKVGEALVDRLPGYREAIRDYGLEGSFESMENMERDYLIERYILSGCRARVAGVQIGLADDEEIARKRFLARARRKKISLKAIKADPHAYALKKVDYRTDLAFLAKSMIDELSEGLRFPRRRRAIRACSHTLAYTLVDVARREYPPQFTLHPYVDLSLEEAKSAFLTDHMNTMSARRFGPPYALEEELAQDTRKAFRV